MATSKSTQTHNQGNESQQGAFNTAQNIGTDAIGGIIGSASRMVLKAADILEEEIARGIVAARQVEDKFADVPKLRSGEITNNRNVDDLIVRFRKDAHDIIDLIVDFASIAAQSAGRITSQFIKVDSPGAQGTGSASQQVPLIQVPHDLLAGTQTEFPVTLENDNANEPKNIYFVNSPLTDNTGNQLPAESLSFQPNPLTISPATRATVTVKINIPLDAKPGSYTSFIQGQNMESLKATLMLKVIPA